MSRNIQELLQECMEGYDAGLTPEDCLSAYPDARNELEPLFRQALTLRMAYAASPTPEFRFRARERLLFAAGRDVSHAMASEPDPEFVQATRQRLLNTAGAAAQEALRDVPPPRLPFWANTRRHLLEAATAAPPKPAPRLASGMRTALSAAVVVLAVAVAGAGFFMQDSPANEPGRSAVGAQLDYITQHLGTAEQQTARGQTVSPGLLDDLASRTSQLAEQYVSGNADPELQEKLPDLIQRIGTLAETSPSNETVASVQQRLAEADQKVTTASVPLEPTNTPEIAAAAGTNPEPFVQVDPEPTATEAVPVPEVTILQPEDLGPGQVSVQIDPGESELGLRWSRVTTSTLTFVMPASWTLTNATTSPDGLAVIEGDYLFVQTAIPSLSLVIRILDGEVYTVANGQQATLREGETGAVMEPAELAATTGLEEDLASLFYTLRSLIVVETGADPDGTPDETSTQDAVPPAGSTP